MKDLSFTPTVRQNIEPLLIKHGFALIEAQQEPFDVLVYERIADNSRITFHNNLEKAIQLGEIRLFVGVTTQESRLASLKELLPTFLSIPLMERGCWTYSNQERLSVCIKEIAQIITERLFDWFKNPVSNPANVPFGHKMTPDVLERQIKAQQHFADLATRDGNVEQLERIEQSIERMKKNLDDILNSDEGSST